MTDVLGHKMKVCPSCRRSWPTVEFPSAGAILCNFCTPTTVDQAIGRHRYEPHVTLTEVEPPLFGGATTEGWKKPDRPLIDSLHEVTFTDNECLTFIQDKYALRMMCRKAHRFMLDAETSRLSADFSVAIRSDLEAARRLAVPPFPVTWIEMDCRARQLRAIELGIRFKTDAPISEVAPRVGWLIYPSDLGGHYALHVMDDVHGPLPFPLSFWWHTNEPNSVVIPHDMDAEMQWLSFGIKNPGVSVKDCFPHPSPTLHVQKPSGKTSKRGLITEMMQEIGGELRYVWGTLIALGAGHMGAEVSTGAPQKHSGTLVKAGDKTVLPLEYKTLTIKLGKRTTVPKLVARVITHHKNRLHEVRSHWRSLKNADGSVRKRVPIKSHKRGDERLGRIEKTYRVER